MVIRQVSMSSDAVNAWRNIARVSNPRNAAASLIVATYCVTPGVGNNSRVGKAIYPGRTPGKGTE